MAVLALSALLFMTPAAAPGDVTAEDVHFYIRAYAVWYSSERYPYTVLVRDVDRVANCETGGFDLAVINNRKLGRLGEVGTGQFHPLGIWPNTPQAQAGYSVRDVEANTAALVWGVANDFGPTAWRGCW